MTQTGTSLRDRINQPQLTCVPVIFNALSAVMAERAGFAAGYVGGASLGYMRAVTEAALTPHDFCDIGLEIRTVTSFPLIVDGGVGWGDPMHMRRNVALIEAAGYDAIEIEDQVAPKRAHHHIGVEHLVSIEEMTAKIEEAVRARKSDDFIIIARTNAAHTMDDALRRCDAYAKAGADMLFPITGDVDQLRTFGERAPLPLVQMVFPGQSFSDMGLSSDDLIALNYRILIDGLTPFADMFEALSASYAGLMKAAPRGEQIRSVMNQAHDLAGLPELLAIERRTTEKGAPGSGSPS